MGRRGDVRTTERAVRGDRAGVEEDARWTSGGPRVLEQVAERRIRIVVRQRAAEYPASGRDPAHEVEPLRMSSRPRHIRFSTRCDSRTAVTPRGVTAYTRLGMPSRAGPPVSFFHLT